LAIVKALPLSIASIALRRYLSYDCYYVLGGLKETKIVAS
jgi:hypothetical protein